MIVLDHQGLPTVFDLSFRRSVEVVRDAGRRSIKRVVSLVSLQYVFEPDYYIAGNARRCTYACIKVSLSVDGRSATLIHRPYELPAVVNGLRLYVEATRDWAAKSEVAEMRVAGDVRLSAVAEGQAWGPPLTFPIRDYRWRSSSYNNTWAALVPYNRHYYHRGEDYGAIPDRLSVVAPLAGKVVASPLPAGDGRSNALSIRSAKGLEARLAHMNIESVDPAIVVGTEVTAGQELARTGCTWEGRRSQTHDPHLHCGLTVGDTMLGSYPHFVEAYLRFYPDAVLAVAGGYHFATAGHEVQLDATRSIARPGRRIVAYRWKLHDGTETDGPLARVRYERPGLYAEELTITADDGRDDRDFAQVRVYEGREGEKVAYGWAYHWPVRGIRPGMPVLLWNRLLGMTGPVTIDFGDGSESREIETETQHAYARPGLYTVTLSGPGAAGQPTTVKMKVVVE